MPVKTKREAASRKKDPDADKVDVQSLVSMGVSRGENSVTLSVVMLKGPHTWPGVAGTYTVVLATTVLNTESSAAVAGRAVTVLYE